LIVKLFKVLLLFTLLIR